MLLTLLSLLRYEENLRVNVAPTAAAASRIFSDPDPSMLARPTATVSPLAGDVMRANDAFQTAAADAASATGGLATC